MGGPWSLTDNSDVSVAESAIKDGYDTFSATDQYPHGWVSVSGATPPYITRGYNNSSGALMSNVNYYLGSDGHPTDRGTAHYGDRLVYDIINSLSNY